MCVSLSLCRSLCLFVSVSQSFIVSLCPSLCHSFCHSISVSQSVCLSLSLYIYSCQLYLFRHLRTKCVYMQRNTLSESWKKRKKKTCAIGKILIDVMLHARVQEFLILEIYFFGKHNYERMWTSPGQENINKLLPLCLSVCLSIYKNSPTSI